jgi:hypothetical protein
MSSRRCQFCGAVLYGRSDKRYCSPTCRRDACRARTRVIRLRGLEIIDSEWRNPLDRHLIPALEREYGPSHRVVHRARRHAAQMREAEQEELRQAMALLDEKWAQE